MPSSLYLHQCACIKEPKSPSPYCRVWNASHQSQPLICRPQKQGPSVWHTPSVSFGGATRGPAADVGAANWGQLWGRGHRGRPERQPSSGPPEILPNWLRSEPLCRLGNLAAWFGASLALNSHWLVVSRGAPVARLRHWLPAGATDRRHKERQWRSPCHRESQRSPRNRCL